MGIRNLTPPFIQSQEASPKPGSIITHFLRVCSVPNGFAAEEATSAVRRGVDFLTLLAPHWPPIGPKSTTPALSLRARAGWLEPPVIRASVEKFL